MAYTYIPSRAAHDAVRCIIQVSCDDQPSAAFCVGRTTRDPQERVMIVIIGLIILVAAVVVGVAGVLSNGGSGHALTHGFAVFGYHVTGSTGTLFLYGVVVGGVAMFGLSLFLTGARRASRPCQQQAQTEHCAPADDDAVEEQCARGTGHVIAEDRETVRECM